MPCFSHTKLPPPTYLLDSFLALTLIKVSSIFWLSLCKMQPQLPALWWQQWGDSWLSEFLWSCFELQQLIFAHSTCMNAFSRLHAMYWLAMCVNKKLHILKNNTSMHVHQPVLVAAGPWIFFSISKKEKFSLYITSLCCTRIHSN